MKSRSQHSWPINTTLWLVPTTAAAFLAYHFLSTPERRVPAYMSGGVNGPLPSPLWWMALGAAMLLPFLFAFRTGRLFGFVSGICFVCLLCSLCMWQRSRHHQDFIVYAHPSDGARKLDGLYCGVFSAGSRIAIARDYRPFRLYSGEYVPWGVDDRSGRVICKYTADELGPSENPWALFAVDDYHNSNYANSYRSKLPRPWVLTCPWWSISLVLAALPIAWTCRQLNRIRRRRRACQLKLCSQCGYDLRSTADGRGPLLERCPECGLPASQSRKV